VKLKSSPRVTIRTFVPAKKLDAWRKALALRYAVFVVEQGVPDGEEVDRHDVHDRTCIHVLAEVGVEAVGTGRLYEDGPGLGKIGRIAVAVGNRGSGIGTAILEVLIKEASLRGLEAVCLDAQLAATGFYSRLGFEPEGPVFVDCGLPHQRMRRVLM
jgi:predicted GNAT family N-acyltransferase